MRSDSKFVSLTFLIIIGYYSHQELNQNKRSSYMLIASILLLHLYTESEAHAK
jgi:hypothetical protein